jgi:hypothetical protein
MSMNKIKWYEMKSKLKFCPSGKYGTMHSKESIEQILQFGTKLYNFDEHFTILHKILQISKKFNTFEQNFTNLNQIFIKLNEIFINLNKILQK